MLSSNKNIKKFSKLNKSNNETAKVCYGYQLYLIYVDIQNTMNTDKKKRDSRKT